MLSTVSGGRRSLGDSPSPSGVRRASAGTQRRYGHAADCDPPFRKVVSGEIRRMEARRGTRGNRRRRRTLRKRAPEDVFHGSRDRFRMRSSQTALSSVKAGSGCPARIDRAAA
jgi:hypothetical protein